MSVVNTLISMQVHLFCSIGVAIGWGSNLSEMYIIMFNVGAEEYIHLPCSHVPMTCTHHRCKEQPL